ncbi:MAG: polysaccharide deacetylase [Gemmatimonadetes bacterium]|nr:polysaccharide deacetylase [Gemmatimonadota bacterium]
MSGALVISLDFEKHWGVIDRPLGGPYMGNLLGVPGSVLGTLALFRDFQVAATWATVGFLFARSREEREQFAPALRPQYADAALDSYVVPTGSDEESDPVHYGASLIEAIVSTPLQEISTHTFSHFFCLEQGVAAKDAFRADLASACAIMQHTVGMTPRSIVFPGNQHNPDFDDVLLKSGITCYRGSPRSWMWSPRPRGESLLVRASRLIDAYVPLGGMHTVPWSAVPEPSGLCNVAASFFLRPYSAGARLRRLRAALRHAARAGEILHLWWHPHNFGTDTETHLNVLRELLVEFDRCRDEFGMQSLTMSDAAMAARARAAPGIDLTRPAPPVRTSSVS